nr:MAG TPA: hypothetical protein [Caudoviricetes sp.]
MITTQNANNNKSKSIGSTRVFSILSIFFLHP